MALGYPGGYKFAVNIANIALVIPFSEVEFFLPNQLLLLIFSPLDRFGARDGLNLGREVPAP